jgi:hypothetical protein
VLLLAGAANLFTVFVDNDDDEETPPITVELSFVATSRKSVPVHKDEISRPSASVARPLPRTKTRADLRQTSLSTPAATGSPEFVVPLRT